MLYYQRSEQQRCWSDCADASLRICCSHTAKQILSWRGSYVFSNATVDDGSPVCSWLAISDHHMSPVVRKPVFGVSDQVRLKPGCAASEASLEISDIETRDIILSRQRTTNELIRLRGCAGWSAPLLFAYSINSFLMTWLILGKTDSIPLPFLRNKDS